MRQPVFLSALIAVGIIFSGYHQAGAIDIGLAWAGKSGMAERVAQGFDQGIAELAPDIKVEYKKELGSIELLGEQVKSWSATKKGLVLLRSNAAEWLGDNPTSIPTFIGACNHPAQLGAVDDMKAPKGNITGVTYFIPAKTQFDIYAAIIPDLKSVFLLVESGHPGSEVDRAETRDVCKDLDIEYNEAVCDSVYDAIAAVKENDGKVSAFIFGNQALLLDNAKAVIDAASKTPFISYASRPVEAGALGGFAANDIKLGYMLAQSVIDVLKKEKSIEDVPVKTDPKPTFFVNVATAQKLGVEIPFDILESARIIE